MAKKHLSAIIKAAYSAATTIKCLNSEIVTKYARANVGWVDTLIPYQVTYMTGTTFCQLIDIILKNLCRVNILDQCFSTGGVGSFWGPIIKLLLQSQHQIQLQNSTMS